jgi:uncharacterized protein (TIGR03905 family)
MTHRYKPKGTCSTMMEFELSDDGKISSLHFTDGCDGNLKAVAILADGMDAEDVVSKLKGTRCGRKRTSCPDQLAIAVEQAMQRKAQELIIY